MQKQYQFDMQLKWSSSSSLRKFVVLTSSSSSWSSSSFSSSSPSCECPRPKEEPLMTSLRDSAPVQRNPHNPRGLRRWSSACQKAKTSHPCPPQKRFPWWIFQRTHEHCSREEGKEYKTDDRFQPLRYCKELYFITRNWWKSSGGVFRKSQLSVLMQK